MVEIIKRDGSKSYFNRDKIIVAINKAFLDVDGTLYETDTSEDIAEDIYQKLKNSYKTYTVEEIQDLVEEYLMRSDRPDVARAYIRYRYKKEVARTYGNDFIDAIKEKLFAKNIQNQNANVDEQSFGGRSGEASSVVTKRLALDSIVSPRSKERHENNEIYIHDLDAYFVGSHNCLSVPFDKLLANGFNTRQTDIRPASSINTAFQLVAVIFQLQSLQQFGGVSATHLDWTMVPYVRKSFIKHYIDGLKYRYVNFHGIAVYEDMKHDTSISIDNDIFTRNELAYEYAIDMTEKEIHQAVEGLYHNLK